jgi:hypothetical protein
MAGEVGFWSYVQADDAADGGRILSLSRKLRDAYRLQTGDEILIFVDRESLEWGSEWAARIEGAIAGTTFFIPIITPSYFRSQSCRKELLKFAREAKRLGLEKLLLPVYWVTVPELDNDPDGSSDEAIVLVAKYQRVDLRDVRLEDETSSVFRKTLARLADDLMQRVTAVTAEATAGELSRTAGAAKDASNEEDDDRPGFVELLVIGEEGLPRLGEILEQVSTQVRLFTELITTASLELQAAKMRNFSMKSALKITESLAAKLTEPSVNIERLGHEYIVLLTSVVPAVHAFLDAAGASVERSPEDVVQRDTFLATLSTTARIANGAVEQVSSLVGTLKEGAKLSRALRIPIKRIQTGLQGFVDGKDLIDEWVRRAGEMQQIGGGR